MHLSNLPALLPWPRPERDGRRHTEERICSAVCGDAHADGWPDSHPGRGTHHPRLRDDIRTLVDLYFIERRTEATDDCPIAAIAVCLHFPRQLHVDSISGAKRVRRRDERFLKGEQDCSLSDDGGRSRCRYSDGIPQNNGIALHVIGGRSPPAILDSEKKRGDKRRPETNKNYKIMQKWSHFPNNRNGSFDTQSL